ncbi:MAG: ATP-dependent DNA helicase RecG [Acidimicrobiia bacterium]|nr:ATP-dependent DNA helicase RecG [bacterium]MYD41404.1 ATP-dependent DNA helicase RecG [Acidimicrobiia bacterium]
MANQTVDKGSRASERGSSPQDSEPSGPGRSLAYLQDVSVERVRNIGPRLAGMLAKSGVRSVADLLQHFPHRYLDRSLVVPIAELPIDGEATLIAEVVRTYRPRASGRTGPREMLKVTVQDPHLRRSGPDRALGGIQRMEITFFNQPFRGRQLHPGVVAAFSGKVTTFRGRPQMTNPDVEVVSSDEESFEGKVVPVHSAVGEMTPVRIRSAVQNALGRARPILDPVPRSILEKGDFMDRDQAFANIHFPSSMDHAREARRRLVFDELFRIQVALSLTRHRLVEEQEGISQRLECQLVTDFLDGLPYDLTGAQKRVLEEIGEDLESGRPMHRLLQGEVGSGKTVVALATLLAAVGSGNQGAIMAPTEVLAEQLYLVLREMLSQGGLSPPVARPQVGGRHIGSLFQAAGSVTVRVALLTSSRAAANYLGNPGRSRVQEDVAAGEAQIVVGTHSLIQERIRFRRLGVVVVDEQHRFGVSQRSTLKHKGADRQPDLLIMTATPIPRTLSMTLYGDLVLSTIDQMPPGRSPVKTRVIDKTPEGLDAAYQAIRTEVARGRQAFVICPLIEDSEKLAVQSVTSQYREITSVLPDLTIDLMHGQLSSVDKEGVMARFRSGETDVLVSTTVIEVGIDIPNATVMVITDAQRFGLSQLHQLRGRVGRGRHPGRCLLVADAATPDSARRMKAMARTTDGLELAREDLRIRGQGAVFGARQSGMGDLRLADILRDLSAMKRAKRAADILVESDPYLHQHPLLAEEIAEVLGDDVQWLFDS